jgi:hypothetical protein
MKTRLPSLEFILRQGLKDALPDLIEGRHPRYKGVEKVEVLRLCSILEKAGYLEIYLTPGVDGPPLPAYGDYINVTVQGRDYLARLDQNKLWRRAFGWVVAFGVGVLTPLLVDWVKLLMKVFAQKHGVAP